MTVLLHQDRLGDAVDLIAAADAGLTDAHWAETVHARWACTRLSVLRAAAAVLAVRAAAGRARAPMTLWDVLPELAPELTEWAEFFAEAMPDPVDGRAPGGELMSVREVDDLLRQGELFVARVAGLLGVPREPLPTALAPLTAGGVTSRARRRSAGRDR